MSCENLFHFEMRFLGEYKYYTHFDLSYCHYYIVYNFFCLVYYYDLLIWFYYYGYFVLYPPFGGKK